MIRNTAVIVLLLMFILPLEGVDIPAGASALDDDSDGMADRWETVNEKGGLSIYLDTDGDGNVDYLLNHDDAGYKYYEAMDFNHDGLLDDFYFYVKEVLFRREIDTNFDGDVDVWVHLTEGVYILSYERDTDFDGEIDLRKSFGDIE